ncbi:hypothetical protein [Pseudohoeflea suaedae]|uniref:hypothetical protein n=1 Tax=Pseudohoeflea suaedae TaxID=877384 RepID=UPI00187F95D9|nr:hypothetical protein [Pseudohoeflea suaedae]
MFMFIVQTFILVAIAFVLGAVAGCWLHSAVGRTEEPEARAESADVSVVSVTVPPQPVAAGAGVPGEAVEDEAIDVSDASPVAAPPAEEAEIVTPRKVAARKAEAKPATKKKPVSKTAKASAPAKPAKPKTAKPKPLAGKDDLKKIKGVGKVIEGKLNAEGITTYAQIAAWTKTDAEAFSEKLDFQGRIGRENWIAQAKALEKAKS